MNIFVINLDPVKAACQLHDKHVNKMVLESAQLLCTTRRLLGDTNPNLYKIAFQNHPCTIWTRQSKENYLWLLDHFNALCGEYTYRYFKHHKCANLITHLAQEIDGFPLKGLTPFALAMPDEFKQEDPVTSYRGYYLGKKIQNQFWTHRAQHELEPWLASQLQPSQFKELDYT